MSLEAGTASGVMLGRIFDNPMRGLSFTISILATSSGQVRAKGEGGRGREEEGD